MDARTRIEDYPIMMTVMEVAEFLRIGRNTAYELVQSGEIPSRKVGRQLRIFRDDLVAYAKGSHT